MMYFDSGRPGRRMSAASRHRKGNNMLTWTFLFLAIALVAAVFGFTGIAAASAGIAKVIFFIFLVIFLISLIFGMRR
jgi:uncharacterized membrane protein YtjA (UPF0391 family)